MVSVTLANDFIPAHAMNRSNQSFIEVNFMLTKIMISTKPSPSILLSLSPPFPDSLSPCPCLLVPLSLHVSLVCGSKGNVLSSPDAIAFPPHPLRHLCRDYFYCRHADHIAGLLSYF